ncbi:MAG: hypothetical protein ACRCWB_08740 [Enterovibrio sp.]
MKNGHVEQAKILPFLLDFFLSPSLQRLAFAVLLAIIAQLLVPVFSVNAPTISEFDTISFLFCSLLASKALVFSTKIVASKKDHAIAFFLALLLLLASFQMTQIALLLLALWLLTLGFRDEKKALVVCGALFAATALNSLLVFFSLKWFTQIVLSVDAVITAFTLRLFHGYGTAVGNVIDAGVGHQVLVLRNCSSLPGMLNMLVCWFALICWHQIKNWRLIALVSLVACGFMLSLNTFRLYSAAISMTWHSWWHSPAGVQMYFFISTFLILLLIGGGLRVANKI